MKRKLKAWSLSGNGCFFSSQEVIFNIFFPNEKKLVFLHSVFHGAVAQSVEQRTENPCVGGSIPSRTTTKSVRTLMNIEFVGVLFFVRTVSEADLGSSFDQVCTNALISLRPDSGRFIDHIYIAQFFNGLNTTIGICNNPNIKPTVASTYSSNEGNRKS